MWTDRRALGLGAKGLAVLCQLRTWSPSEAHCPAISLLSDASCFSALTPQEGKGVQKGCFQRLCVGWGWESG